MTNSEPSDDVVGVDWPVSLEGVAAKSGVSLATASRVLNPDSTHPVRESTRKAVLRAAADLDYRVNALARGLRKRRSQTVGVMVHDIRDPYFNECARGVANAAGSTGFLTVICSSDRSPRSELGYMKLLLESRAAGVLFVGGGLEDATYRSEMRGHIAAMRDYGGHAIALGPRVDPLPAELPENRGGARLAVEHLVELGHERIVFIDGPEGLKTSAERLAGYREGVEAAGLPFDERLVVRGHFTEEGGAAAMQAVIDAGVQFTAVFSSNDIMALGCQQVLTEAGLRQPDDVSLVGFDDIRVVRWLDPPLTTVAVPMEEVGAAGMRRLIALLDDEPGAADGPMVNMHPTHMVVRGSTGPVKGRTRHEV